MKRGDQMLLGQLVMEAMQITRKETKRLLKEGQITIDNTPCYDYAKVVDAGWMTIAVKQTIISPTYGHDYFIVNKPKGYVSANKDAQLKTVLDLIANEDNPGNLSISGRLDRDAHGLVFLTNNGQLHYILQQPKFDIDKTYQVTVNGLMDGKMIDQFQAGVSFLDGTVCKPATLQILEASPTSSTGLVTISEGQRHQIKKMFLSCGVKVTDLYRLTVGALSLENLEEGNYRRLTEEEKLALKNIFLLYNKRKNSSQN